jgi:hypothetical protein
MTDEVQPQGEDPKVTELERRLAELEAATQQRVLHAELRSHATRAGMVDLDGLKLLDTSALKLTETGELEGGAKLMSDLRRAKPWLFQSASSSSPAVPPPNRPQPVKRATEMSHAEWRAARAELLRRR